jgi:hypothetical protein
MVCLYGTILNIVEKKLSEEEKKEYPTWSWLIYRLTAYIYQLNPENVMPPKIPDINDDTIYGQWFTCIMEKLGDTFNDATPETVFRCLEKTPAEEVALTVFSCADIHLLKSFSQYLVLWEPNNNKINANKQPPFYNTTG